MCAPISCNAKTKHIFLLRSLFSCRITIKLVLLLTGGLTLPRRYLQSLKEPPTQSRQKKGGTKNPRRGSALDRHGHVRQNVFAMTCSQKTLFATDLVRHRPRSPRMCSPRTRSPRTRSPQTCSPHTCFATGLGAKDAYGRPT